MKRGYFLPGGAIWLAGVTMLFAVPRATAASVFINDPTRIGPDATAVAGMKVRASTTNWDQSLDAGGGTFAGNFISANLGNTFTGGGRDFGFSIEHRAGQGFVFRITEAGRPDSVLAWGDFGGAVPGQVVSTINGRTPLTPFNALGIEARSTRPGASVSFSQMLFTSPTLSVAGGTFSSGTVTENTTSGTSPTGTVQQSLIADTGMALHDWTLTGIINLIRPAGAGGDENVKFTVNVLQSDYIAHAPEPGTALLGALAGLTLLQRRRRTTATQSA